MKIVQVHNVYQLPGGEDVVVAAERELLTRHGHDVNVYGADNKQIISKKMAIKTAIDSVFSEFHYRKFRALLESSGPDVVHVHNTFPMITPSILYACHDVGVPVCQTLHNYRIFCAGATITRNGKTCTDCLDGSPYQAVLHGCYRNSRIGSLVVARMIDSHRRRRTWQTKVDSFIVLSEMAKAYFTRLGIASDKISIIHNFARELSPDLVGIWRAPAPDRPTGLFVGRLTTNKGLDLLINAVQGLDVRLTIIGDGPLQEMVREAERGGQVSWLGQQPPEVVAAHMQSADFLIFPSVDVEGQPLVIIEACRSGLPTICSGCDPRGEFLEDGRNCLTFSRGDVGQLRQRINELAASSALRALLSQGARETYQQLFSEGAHYCKLIALYQTIIMQRQGLGS